MNNLFDKDIAFNSLPDLPPRVNLDTPEVFKVTIRANKFLAELRGFCQTLPNPTMLLNTIGIMQKLRNSHETVRKHRGTKLANPFDGRDYPHRLLF